MLHTKITRLKDRYSLVKISPRIAFIYRALKRASIDGRKDVIQCAYFGFNEEVKAQKYALWLQQNFSNVRYITRESERLDDCQIEVKVFRFEKILDLIQATAAVA
jgi:hypothetical protein